jgi:chromosome partitioning protein
MIKASKICAALAQNGQLAFRKAKQNGWSPNLEKTLYPFRITEAAKMCGRTSQNIRNLEDAGKLPAPKIDYVGEKNSKRRIYTLSDINRMRDYFNTRPHKPDGAPPAVIMMGNFKGGVTKSHSSVHLAQYLALKGYKTLIMDLDSQATTTILFGFSPLEDLKSEETLLSFFNKPTQGLTEDSKSFYTSDLYSLIKKTYFPGVDIIPSNLSLYNVEFKIPILNALAQQNNIPFELHSILRDGIFGNKSIKGIADVYDVIILDCPPSLGVLSINAVYAANSLVVPLPPVLIDLASTTEFFGMLSDVFSVYPDKEFDFVKILVSKHKRNDRKSHNYKIAESLKSIFGKHILESTMIASEAVEKSNTNVKTIYDTKISEFEGDRETIIKAIAAADDVNLEIEQNIIQTTWMKPNTNRNTK